MADEIRVQTPNLSKEQACARALENAGGQELHRLDKAASFNWPTVFTKAQLLPSFFSLEPPLRKPVVE
jgi:hypothetical protein